eukprot:scaffold99386_cov30-Cyclotella_meneghiniana.AAC.2
MQQRLQQREKPPATGGRNTEAAYDNYINNNNNNDAPYTQQTLMMRIPLSAQITRHNALQILNPLIPEDFKATTPLEHLDNAFLLAKTMPRCQDDAKKKWRVGSNFYVQKIPIHKKSENCACALSFSPIQMLPGEAETSSAGA